MRAHKHRLRLWFCLLLSCITLAVAPVSAADSKPSDKPTDISGAVTQSYDADSSVQLGMIVKLQKKDAAIVVPLDEKSIKTMLGVVVPQGKSTIVLTPETTKQQQVLVATTGRVSVLVSNQNGPIQAGDQVTISSVSGIAMKATSQQEQILGTAAGNFTGSGDVVGNVKLKDSLGRESSVSIGRIQVDLNITRNPLAQKTVDFLPGFLVNYANSIANKPVSVARIYAATLLLACTAIITSNMMYSGVRSGMNAVGRNPLSRKSIVRSLIQTVIGGLIVFIAGVFAVYLLLKL